MIDVIDTKQKFHTALVLEGGSLRCLFTAGVLDVFMEQNLWLPYVIGVSAGSLSGINYVSGQIGRTAKVNLEYVDDKRYLGIRNLLKGKGIFNFDFLFGEITDRLIPLDKETFYHSPIRYLAVATCCEDGTPRYFERDHCKDIMLAARASSSMPLLARMVEFEGEHLLDGGISMPIAYEKAEEDGYSKRVLILTREHGYRKHQPSNAILTAFEKAYRQYPQLVEKLLTMPQRYNQMQEEIDSLERRGEIFVIRPEFPVGISRVEKDREKLNHLYQEGRRIAKKQLKALYQFLEESKDYPQHPKKRNSFEKKLVSSL